MAAEIAGSHQRALGEDKDKDKDKATKGWWLCSEETGSMGVTLLRGWLDCAAPS